MQPRANFKLKWVCKLTAAAFNYAGEDFFFFFFFFCRELRVFHKVKKKKKSVRSHQTFKCLTCWIMEVNNVLFTDKLFRHNLKTWITFKNRIYEKLMFRAHFWGLMPTSKYINHRVYTSFCNKISNNNNKLNCLKCHQCTEMAHFSGNYYRILVGWYYQLMLAYHRCICVGVYVVLFAPIWDANENFFCF